MGWFCFQRWSIKSFQKKGNFPKSTLPKPRVKNYSHSFSYNSKAFPYWRANVKARGQAAQRRMAQWDLHPFIRSRPISNISTFCGDLIVGPSPKRISENILLNQLKNQTPKEVKKGVLQWFGDQSDSNDSTSLNHSKWRGKRSFRSQRANRLQPPEISTLAAWIFRTHNDRCALGRAFPLNNPPATQTWVMMISPSQLLLYRVHGISKGASLPFLAHFEAWIPHP